MTGLALRRGMGSGTVTSAVVEVMVYILLTGVESACCEARDVAHGGQSLPHVSG